jgi:hypothetical protein
MRLRGAEAPLFHGGVEGALTFAPDIGRKRDIRIKMYLQICA